MHPAKQSNAGCMIFSENRVPIGLNRHQAWIFRQLFSNFEGIPHNMMFKISNEDFVMFRKQIYKLFLGLT